MVITFTSIGIIHTPFQTTDDMPIQSIRSDERGTVEVFPEYLEGLEGIEDLSHIILIYVFHRLQGAVKLKVKPFLDDKEHGLFVTRYPNRPNPLGLSVVRIISRNKNHLEIQGVDMLDGTPLLDIKPYLPEFDIHQVTKTGWYEKRSKV